MERIAHPAIAGAAPSLRHEPLRAPTSRNQSLVLEELKSAARPLKAYDLLERLRDRGVNAPMTVYRALDRLMAAGRVKKIASLNAFFATSHAESAVLICGDCGATAERPLPPDLLRIIFDDAGMSIGSAFVEAHGSCGCEAPGSRRAAG